MKSMFSTLKSNRYFYYIVFINMLTNVVMFVPQILLKYRFEGTLMAIAAAMPIGIAFTWVFCTCMNKFPAKTLPEILETYTPKWFRIAFLIIFGSIWFFAGSLSLITYAEITNRFISPETSQISTLILYMLLVVWVATFKSDRFMYGIEIFFLINVPLIFLILIKSLTERIFSWTTVMEICTHLPNLPNLPLIGAATYIFSGYANLMIFNKHFPVKLDWVAITGVFGVGSATLLTSFLIPIGFYGTFAAAEYSFPWVVTVDSIRLEYFPIERVMVPFLLLYLMMTIMSSSIQWHVGRLLYQGLLQKQSVWISWAILGCFFGGTMLEALLLNNDLKLLRFATLFLNLRLFAEVVLLGVLIYAVRRKQKNDKKNQQNDDSSSADHKYADGAGGMRV